MDRATLRPRLCDSIAWLSLALLTATSVGAQEPPPLQYWAGHETPLYAVAYSQDGKVVLSTGVDGSVRVWDRATGGVLRRLAAHQGPALTLAVAPDDRTFASAGRDGRVRWFDLARPNPLFELPGVPGAPAALAVAADAPLVATGDQANIVRLWDSTTKNHLRDFGGATGGVTAVAIDFASKQILAASADGFVRVWNLDNAQLQTALAVSPSLAMSFSQDGKTLALAGQDGVLRLAFWPPAPPLTLVTHNDQAVAGDVSPDGQLALTAGLDSQVHLIQTADAKIARSLGGLPAKPTTAGFNRDVSLAAVGTDNGLLKFWQVGDGVDRGVLAGHAAAISGLAWNPAGPELASSSQDGTIRVWLPPTPPQKWGAHNGPVDRLTPAPDSPLAATVGPDKTVRIWDVAAGKLVRTAENLPNPAVIAAIGARGARLAWGDSTGLLFEQSLPDGAGSASVGAHSASVTGLVYDPAGKWIASSGADGTVKVWSLPLAEPRTTPPLPEAPALLAPLVADQLLAASGGADPYVFDLATGKPLRSLVGLGAPATCLGSRLDGTLVAAGSAQGTVRFWNPADGRLAGELAGHEGGATGLAIHPQQPLVATGSADGSVRVWRLPELPAQLEARPAAGAATTKPTAASPDGSLVAIGQPDGAVQLYRESTLQAGRRIAVGAKPVVAVGLRRDGQELAAGDLEGRLQLSNLEGQSAGAVWAHDGAVTSVGYAAAGDRLLTTGADGLARLWQTPLVAPHVTAKPNAAVAAQAVSPDGSKLYLAGADKTLKAFDAGSGGALYAVDQLPAATTALALQPNGELLALGDETGVVRLRAAADGTARAALGGHAGPVRAAAFNPKRPQFATAGEDGRVRLWEIPPPVAALSGHQGRIGRMALSPNGQSIATASADKSARLWNVAGGAVAWLLGDSAEVTCVAWKSDGAQVVTGNANKQVRVWNAGDGQQVALFEGHAAPISQVAFLPDGSVVSVAADGQMKFWNVAEKKEIAALAAHSQTLVGLVVPPGNTQLLGIGADGAIKSWNLADRKPALDQPGAAPAGCAALSPDGKLIALGGPDKTVRLVPAGGGAPVAALAGARDAIVSVAFSPDSQRVAAASADGEVRVYSVAGVAQESVALQPHKPTSVAFTADSKGLIVAASDQQLHVVRLSWIKTLEVSPQPLAALAFLPDGDQLLIGGRNNLATVWNVQSGAAVRNLGGPADAVTAVAVSPDGARLAAGGADKVLRIWNAADGAALPQVQSAAAIRDVAFSRDGLKLAFGAEDGSVRIVETATGRTWQRWLEQPKPVVGVSWGPDPRAIFVASADGTALRLTLGVSALSAPEGGLVGAALAPNAQTLVTWNANDKAARSWTITGQAGPQFGGPEAPLVAVTLRADGAQAAGVSADRHLYFWQTGNGQLERKVPLGALPTSVVYSADSLRVAVSTDDGGVRIVQAADGRVLESVRSPVADPKTPPLAVVGTLLLPTPPAPNQTSPPAERIVAVQADGRIEVRKSALVRLLAGHQGPVHELAWTPDAQFLYSAGADKTVRQWAVANGQPVRALGGLGDVCTGLAVVAGGQKIAGSSLDKHLRIWNVSDGGAAATIATAQPLRRLTATREGDAVFTTGDDGIVRLWDVATGKELERHAAAGGIGPTALGVGRSLAYVAADKSLRAWRPSIVRAFVADAAAVHSLALAPDGKQLLTSGGDAAVKLWDADGKLVRQYAGSPAPWKHLFVSADGQTLVGGGDPNRQQGVIMRWKLADGAGLAPISTPAPLFSLQLAADGRMVAAGADGKVRIYGPVDGRLLEEFSAPAPVPTIAFTPDGRSLIAGQADGGVVRLQVGLQQILTGHEGAVLGVAWSPDGKELFSAGFDKTIRRWDVAAGKQVGSFAGLAAGATSLGLSRDGSTLAVASSDQVVRVYPVAARPAGGVLNDVAAKQTYAPQAAYIRTVKLNRDGAVLATAGDDGIVRLWDGGSGKELERLAGHTGAIYSLVLTDDGRSVQSASADRTVRRWTTSVRLATAAHEGPIQDVKFAAYGARIVTVGADKRVKIWNAADLKLLHALETGGALKTVAASRDGALIVAGGDDQTLRVWNAADGSPTAELKLPAPITGAAAGHAGRRIVVGGADGVLRLFTLTTAAGKSQLEPLQEIKAHAGAVVRVVLSSDERTATTVGGDQIVRRWTAAGPGPLLDLSGNDRAVYGLAFRPDGLELAGVGGDRSLRTWKLPGGEPAVTAKEHTGPVSAVAYHPSGKQLATASDDGSIRLWDETGKSTGRISVGITGRLRTVAYSPDGNAVLTGGTSKSWQVFNRDSLLALKTFDAHNDAVYQLAYNKAGNRIATLDYSGKLFLWDAGGGTALFHLQLPVVAATGLAYSPDGVELAIASRDPRLIRVILPPPVR